MHQSIMHQYDKTSISWKTSCLRINFKLLKNFSDIKILMRPERYERRYVSHSCQGIDVFSICWSPPFNTAKYRKSLRRKAKSNKLLISINRKWIIHKTFLDDITFLDPHCIVCLSKRELKVSLKIYPLINKAT